MRDKLRDALDHISDRHIAEAAAAKNRRRFYLPAAVAAILALALVIGVLIQPLMSGTKGNVTLSNQLLVAEPQYPQLTQHPSISGKTGAWKSDYQALHDQPEGYADSLDPYFATITETLLSGAEGENAACSPVNIYLALAMLAETTDGDSRQQILDLLGADSIKDLRSQARQVWEAHYYNDGYTTSILANSLWLKDGYAYNQKTADLLADKYYASVFQADLGSRKADLALQGWINEQTGGVLKEQAEGIKLQPSSVLALVSTLYYQVQWQQQNLFREKNNTEAIFHSTGGDTSETFMNQTLWYSTYYWGDHFSAVPLSLEDDSRMWLILPDEGTTPEELLSSGEAMAFLQQDLRKYKNKATPKINLSIPKFDICSDTELSNQLKELGVTDAFDQDTADFSPIFPQQDPIYVSEVKHAARVAIDEEGVTAASYTLIAAGAGGVPVHEDEIDFVLDRPFLFVIESQDGLPLFAGVVNQP